MPPKEGPRDEAKLPETQPVPKAPTSSRPPSKRKTGMLGGLLPGNIDMSDIMLLAVLLLLYNDSKDEDFLIILGVMALSILRPQEK